MISKEKLKELELFIIKRKSKGGVAAKKKQKTRQIHVEWEKQWAHDVRRGVWLGAGNLS